jgi:DNA (cytosine-5)-methyltransferase 1
LKVVSLFSGCGGLDLGFTRAGFDIVYANDNDKTVWETYERNHGIAIDKRSLLDVKSEEIPNANGIIGGPPCQSWSLAGMMRGAKDERGQLFYEYVRVLRDKRPDFFLAENVPGIVSSTHIQEFKAIVGKLSELGYDVAYKLVDARDYGVPQERRRIIIIGYKWALGLRFTFPSPTYTKTGALTLEKRKTEKWVTLKEAIGDLPTPIPSKEKNKANGNLAIINHEYMIGSFSSIYMSRNRRKQWNEQSYTIQAGGRHAPLHPSSTEMVKIEEDKWTFKNKNPVYRRLSVRECARIQTFPDNFIFSYQNVADGYKMVGNAVPVRLAEAIARKIRSDLEPKLKDYATLRIESS